MFVDQLNCTLAIDSPFQTFAAGHLLFTLVSIVYKYFTLHNSIKCWHKYSFMFSVSGLIRVICFAIFPIYCCFI